MVCGLRQKDWKRDMTKKNVTQKYGSQDSELRDKLGQKSTQAGHNPSNLLPVSPYFLIPHSDAKFLNERIH